MLAALVLLVLFHQVVRGAVQQGELRQAAAAADAESKWRCKDPGVLRDRDICLSRMSRTPHDEAFVQARNVER